jgi:hypothetical protein
MSPPCTKKSGRVGAGAGLVRSGVIFCNWQWRSFGAPSANPPSKFSAFQVVALLEEKNVDYFYATLCFKKKQEYMKII